MNGKELATKFRELKPTIKDNLRDAAHDGLSEITKPEAERIIVSRDIEYRGDTRRSLRVVRTNDGDGYVLKAGGPQAPHAPYTELGTGGKYGVSKYGGEANFGPYKAPKFSGALIENIGEWIDHEGIVARKTSQSNLKFAIAASIAEKGTPSQPFMRPAWFHTVEDLKKNGRHAVRKSVDDF